MGWFSGLFGSGNESSNNYKNSERDNFEKTTSLPAQVIEDYDRAIRGTTQVTREATSVLEKSTREIERAGCKRSLSYAELQIAKSKLSGAPSEGREARQKYKDIFERCRSL